MRYQGRHLICLLLAGGLLLFFPLIGHAAEGIPRGLRLHLELAQAGAGQAGAPAPGSGGMALSLKECIALALQNNLDISVELFNPQLRQQDLVNQQSAFDLNAFMGAQRTDNRLLRSQDHAGIRKPKGIESLEDPCQKSVRAERKQRLGVPHP